MKRIMSVLGACVLALCVAGCGHDATSFEAAMKKALYSVAPAATAAPQATPPAATPRRRALRPGYVHPKLPGQTKQSPPAVQQTAPVQADPAAAPQNAPTVTPAPATGKAPVVAPKPGKWNKFKDFFRKKPLPSKKPPADPKKTG